MGKCLFSERWLTLPQYSRWLARGSSGIHKAYCCLCSKSFDISAMGEAALKSHNAHMIGKKRVDLDQNPKQGWDWHDESFSRPSNNKTKKKRILADIESLNKTADKLAEKAERTGQIPLITQSNSLRKTAKAKDVELKDLGQKLEDKMQSIKDL